MKPSLLGYVYSDRESDVQSSRTVDFFQVHTIIPGKKKDAISNSDTINFLARNFHVTKTCDILPMNLIELAFNTSDFIFLNSSQQPLNIVTQHLS